MRAYLFWNVAQSMLIGLATSKATYRYLFKGQAFEENCREGMSRDIKLLKLQVSLYITQNTF
jgi:hypothetical protein